MAKKKHRPNGPGRGPGAEASAAAPPAAAGEPEGRGEGQPGAAPKDIGEAELALALRALRWLSSQPRTAVGEVHEALLDAARPLIMMRAAKYEEDAKANKMAELASGGYAAVRAGGPGGLKAPNKRPHSAMAAPDGAGSDEDAPEGQELGGVARVLRELAREADLLASKACKPLRAALHPLVEAHLQEEKASPAFRVTCMLGQRSRWPQALRLLAEMRGLDAGRRPKLGAYQRWVRELGVAEGDPEELAVLDAIMRVAAGLPPSVAPLPAKGSLARSPPWQAVQRPCAAAAAPSTAASTSAAPAAAGNAGGDSKEEAEEEAKPVSTASRIFGLIATRRSEAAARVGASLAGWSVLAHEAAHDRKPPNHFDLDIYTCARDTLPLSSPPPSPVARHDVPGVDGAFVLSDVLSARECETLREVSEAIGYRPDVPLSSALDERAQNVVIMASEEQNDVIFSRVRGSLPQELGGDRLIGLNRRWRLYRYAEGNLYRKHLDGSWPSSGTRSGPGGRQEYVYDARGGCRSRLTFIVYLNDNFEGGETTFFVPRPSSEGQLEARPVQPLVGCATVFPHGDTGVPLLHEGSSVSRGQKYLLRTDVVYVAASSGVEAQEAARLRGLARQLGGLGGKDLTEAREELFQKEPEARKPGQTRRVIKRGLKGKERGEGAPATRDFRESKKPGSKRTSKRNKGKQKEAPTGSMAPGKKSTRRKDARAAAKLKMVGRLKTGKKAAAAA
mmetsp:Transcript_99922/g.312157  ORF Transcript_99922/g.312157 Transcript_99922/m.312157 type:complete len:732 (+) Transcript_99922:30-2225(+)